MKELNRFRTYSLIVLGILLIFTNSCKKVDDNVLVIGQSYQGGIIAYILLPGDPGYNAKIQHGLIAAPSDQSTSTTWYNGSNTSTGATATVLEAGNDNTNTIVASQGAGSYAAKLCYDLVLSSYTDWYLPSKDELNKVYLAKAAIGGFTTQFYWSSTESDASIAWVQDFTGGSQVTEGKYNQLHVRAIRRF